MSDSDSSQLRTPRSLSEICLIYEFHSTCIYNTKMGICASKTQVSHIVASVPRSSVSERRKLSLAWRLVQMRRLEEAPALVLAKSKLYLSRKKKSEMSSNETLGSGLDNSSGSMGEIAIS